MQTFLKIKNPFTEVKGFFSLRHCNQNLITLDLQVCFKGY